MTMESISPEEARRLVLRPSAVEVWWLGHALDRAGEALEGGVSAQLLADVLEVGEPETWPRTTRESPPAEPFAPYCTVPKDDGRVYRSWLPQDLTAEDEQPLRAFASTSRNDLVRARVFEVLWVRFNKYPDGKAAVDARFASATQIGVEDDWPAAVRNLGRLSALLIQLNQAARFPALVDALAMSAASLLASSRPFSFPVLADMVLNTLLKKSVGRDTFTAERARAWANDLAAVASRYANDPFYGHEALMVLQAWRARWGDQVGADAAKRQVVANLRQAASSSKHVVATQYIQRALQAALDFGLGDLADELRAELMRSITAAMPDFKQISGTFSVPAEVLADVDLIADSAPTAAAAIRQLAVLPGLLEVDEQALRDATREQLREHPFAALVPTAHLHLDGKVTFQSRGFEDNLERHVALLIGMQLGLAEVVLSYFLKRVRSRIAAGTLLSSLGAWPHLPSHRAEMLAVASERFAQADYVSAGALASTQYEAVLRDLMRASGYPALKVNHGVQVDETLNSLLRARPVRDVLGDPHARLAEYVLCDSGLGWNLRNEVAHGTIRPGDLSPGRVLLVWLLLVRVTCFVAQPADSRGQASEAPHDGGASEGPESPTGPTPVPAGPIG
jgi:hypothetical protein